MHGKTFGIALAAVATLALTSSLALARPGGGPGAGAGGCPGYGGGMAQLSPEKQAAFQKLHDAYAAKTAQLRADLGVKRAELNALVIAQNPDQAKITDLSKQIGDIEGKLIAERTQFRIQVSKEIGPNVMGGYHGGMMGGMMGGGSGPCGGAGGGCQ
ncbi:periplasmic heavy metal sensor [Solidesulfovibrio sp.]|uniref:periplasmic heavy metal sensor n=1 Tax=Solidesulfovibrio sp. TaxID=2910990 RepID=UPI002601A4F3|nr:periplasmic heavy metal sensor [Solidesulfovibrio sp.]